MSAENKPPIPKLVGPVYPEYRDPFAPPVVICISAILACIRPAKKAILVPKVSPVKLMAPLPVATTLDPICSSVMVKAWAGWTEKSDVQATAVRASRILGKGFMRMLIALMMPM